MRIDRLDPAVWGPALRTAADLCTQTTDQPAGALCVGVAGTVHATLRHYGVQCKLVGGAAIYRAGPHEMLDVVAFCGRGNRPAPELQLFHAWVEAHASTGAKWVVDFTPKYWRASEHRMTEVTIPGVQLPPIAWAVPPPEQFVGPMSEIVYRLKPGEHTPPPGRLTLIRCARTTALVRKMNAGNRAIAVDRSGRQVEMVNAPADDAGIEAMLEQMMARGITEFTLVYPDEKTGELVRHSTIRAK